MFYFKLFAFAFAIQFLVFVNMAIFVGLDNLSADNRIGYSIMALLGTAVAWLILAGANHPMKNSDTGYNHD